MSHKPDIAHERILFVGLGAMGLPMAKNLSSAGFAVVGHDLDPTRGAALVAAGGEVAASLTDAAPSATVVITMLPTGAHVKAVLRDSGVLAALTPGSLVVDMSTIDPEETDALAAACAERGVQWADAPVGRLVSHAERGESLFMVGADDAAFARCLPLLRSMGTAIHRCGARGTGARMKLVNNLLAIASAQLTAEAMVLGASFGLEAEVMIEVAGGTTATNGQLVTNFPSKVLIGDVAPGFTIDLAYKDLTLALAAAGRMRLGLPVGAAAHAALGAARSGESAGRDFSALLDHAAAIAGIAPIRLPR
jgi:4-hydroxybutyrate dehydrogenase/sulfolactaldehyde 3-reductase